MRPMPMRMNASRIIIASELLTISILFSTLMPLVIHAMKFSPLQLFHYLNINMFILLPLALGLLFVFIDRVECRPLEMLFFYLERRLKPPDDVTAAARARALNLPFVHAVSILLRYELAVIIGCIYMRIVGGLSHTETLRLGLYSGLGIVFFPIFSFFLTERFLHPIRHMLAEKTDAVAMDRHRIMVIDTSRRLVSILLATVILPILAMGVLVYRQMDTELYAIIGGTPAIQTLMTRLFYIIVAVIAVSVVLASGVGLLLATSISTPLAHMVNVIRRIERGDLKARSNLLSNDEIGLLSQSFDRMAHELEKNRGELEDLNRNLEQRVAEKTENLTKAYERLQVSNKNLAIVNRELEEANKKLKELDQLKSDFISIVSHELRTPLTSIKAFAELILMKPQMSKDKQQRLLRIINAETDRLARLINDILDITKIEAGKMGWRIGKLSVEDVIQTSVAGIQPLADAKSLHIHTSVEPYMPHIMGDRDRLIQVMTNILSNAIKFTPQGGSIRINARLERTPRPQILVETSDTGVGIKREELEGIFEKFRRTGDLLTSSAEGTGLGLAISRQIIEHHGGEIWATSDMGYGSTFTFSLPLDKTWTEA